MVVHKLCENVHNVGAIDWDRRLFDELIPLPDGPSYNAYLVKGSGKTALIDTVDPTKDAELVANLVKLGVKRLDYIIANHAEQDHSGSIPVLLEIYPDAKVVTNEKCKSMLADLLLIDEDRFIVVGGGETLSLGDKTLKFILAPWVHWPETMFTYLPEDKILFTCDFLGSHLATSHLYARDEERVMTAAKRYYAEIMMPFRIIIRKHLEKIEGMDVNIIAPSHGPVYDKFDIIIDAYKGWVSDEVENTAVIVYTSMHKSTSKMVDYLAGALMDRGVTVKLHNMTVADVGELAMDLVDAATLVVASPTVLAGPHPSVLYAAILANALRPKVKFAALVGSYGWGEKLTEPIINSVGNLNVELLEPVLAKGHPRDGDYEALEVLADTIAAKHQEHKII